jgi:hypothetical protein
MLKYNFFHCSNSRTTSTDDDSDYTILDEPQTRLIFFLLLPHNFAIIHRSQFSREDSQFARGNSDHLPGTSDRRRRGKNTCIYSTRKYLYIYSYEKILVYIPRVLQKPKIVGSSSPSNPERVRQAVAIARPTVVTERS